MIIMGSNSVKKVYLEAMRIIACALVIFNHTPGFGLYNNSDGAMQVIYLCLAIITRINVPLFFMISGSLLLRKNEEWTFVFKRRFLRIVFLLIIFNFALMTICKAWSIRDGNEYDFSFIHLFRGVINNEMNGSGPYWYLYSYLGILFYQLYRG